ncbi:MAG: hypothetical protein HS113_24440 [Verrucomicrobiales bacterium]|nr:hypothetical protein [Verrucomicrobiales bacterium]
MATSGLACDRRQFYEPISRTHPNLVGVLHVGGDEAGFYYVMELADAVQTGRLAGQNPEASSTAPPCTVEPDAYAPRTLRADLKARGHPAGASLDFAVSDRKRC